MLLKFGLEQFLWVVMDRLITLLFRIWETGGLNLNQRKRLMINAMKFVVLRNRILCYINFFLNECHSLCEQREFFRGEIMYSYNIWKRKFGSQMRPLRTEKPLSVQTIHHNLGGYWYMIRSLQDAFLKKKVICSKGNYKSKDMDYTTIYLQSSPSILS